MPTASIPAAIGLTAAEAGAGAAAASAGATVLGGAGETALLASAGIPAVAASSLPSLSTIGTVAGVGGTLLSAKGGLDNASYQAAVQRAEAAALAQKANQDAAAGEQQQIARARTTELALSRAQALGAASGTDATSPDILTTEGRIAQQGSYNSASALYDGLAKARTDTYQGDIDLFNANRTQAGAPLAATGTILQGLSGFVDKRSRLKYFTAGGGDNFFGFGAT